MRRALGEPALQVFAGIAATIGFTWPLLVFERPVYVFVSFFVIWALVIACLFAISRAPDPSAVAADPDPEGPRA